VLLSAGADPNAPAIGKVKASRITPVHCAASSGWKKVAYLLFDHGGSAFSTGQCSPYCWSDEDPSYSSSMRGLGVGDVNEPKSMRELMRVHLSDKQFEEITAEHERWFRPTEFVGKEDQNIEPLKDN